MERSKDKNELLEWMQARGIVFYLQGELDFSFKLQLLWMEDM